jgi:hypothetical protein
MPFEYETDDFSLWFWGGFYAKRSYKTQRQRPMSQTPVT